MENHPDSKHNLYNAYDTPVNNLSETNLPKELQHRDAMPACTRSLHIAAEHGAYLLNSLGVMAGQ